MISVKMGKRSLPLPSFASHRKGAFIFSLYSFFFLLFSSSPTRFVTADLPVHCLAHQVAGTWDLILTPASPSRSSCGHHTPDSQWRQPSVSQFVGLAREDNQTPDLRWVLLLPNNVLNTKGDRIGSWTMVYDEGFEMKSDEYTFFAFSGFTLDKGDDGKPVNQTYCDRTMVGWYTTSSPQDRQQSLFGCFFAQRAPDQHPTPTSPPPQPQSHALLGTPDQPPYGSPLSYQNHFDFVQRINAVQSSWRAKVHASLLGMSTEDINRRAGIRRSRPDVASHRPPNDLEGLSEGGDSFLLIGRKRRTHRALQPDAPIFPKSLDWRNHNGMNFLEPVMDQGDCGSCYVVATIRMLTARHRVQANDPNLSPFSISFPLHCAEYNQGCAGGYAFLASKWSHDVGLLPSECAPYDSRGDCNAKCPSSAMKTLYRAKNYGYVGGFYGASNERQIIEALQGGPVVVSLEPKTDLMFYSSGVYNSTPERLHQEWEKVDHALLLVGYGQELSGQKYWIIQNSWGSSWGENGFIRLVRGNNDSGVESIAVVADVEESPNVAPMHSFVTIT